MSNSRIAVSYKEYAKGAVVQTTYKSDGARGVTAHIDFDKDWLHICTDDYEGHAMIHIEALPQIRRALNSIAKKLRAKAAP